VSPAAPGEAMLVPESDSVPQLFVVMFRSLFAETMPDPGTVISGLRRPSVVGPQLLNEAMELALVLRSVAPTETPFLAVDGLPTEPVPGPELPAAKKIMQWAYLTQIGPGPIFTGVEKPMKVYSFDNVIITSAKVSDDLVYKILDLMEKNKDELIAVQPVLREWSPAFGYKQYGVPYHPGALKFFKERNLTPQPLG